MPRAILTLLGLALLATGTSLAGFGRIADWAVLLLFGSVMILTLLTVVNDSDKQPR